MGGFQKTKLLTPGDFDEVGFQLFPLDLSYYDVNNGGNWREVDEVVIHFGESSADIRHSLSLTRGVDGTWRGPHAPGPSPAIVANIPSQPSPHPEPLAAAHVPEQPAFNPELPPSRGGFVK